LTDIGFNYSVFQDIEIFYWTVNGTFGWFVSVILINQLPEIKVKDEFLPDKSRTARFVKCGNYFSSRKNSKYKLVFLRALMNPRWLAAGNPD
jgi:hypothetical protein